MRREIFSAVDPLRISSQPEMLPSSGAFSKFSSASITASFHKRTMKIYRMHRSVRATGDYTGAMLAGGRWNPIGAPMLYTAQHLSLACIEVLVHLDKSQLPRDYIWSRTELPNTPGALPFGNLNHIASCQAVGHSWVVTGNQLAVQVPSIVIPEEVNVLLNPKHASFHDLEWSEPRPFRFDPRLFITEPQTL